MAENLEFDAEAKTITGSWDYADWNASEDEDIICLDGNFTIAQLEQIIAFMKEHQQ